MGELYTENGSKVIDDSKVIAFLKKINKLTININKLYDSPLSIQFNNERVCRLTADIFEEIACISILLYNSNQNSLVNIGHYIDPIRSKMKFSNESKEYEAVIRNKVFFDYLSYKMAINELNKLNYDDFKEFTISEPKEIFLGSSYVKCNRESFDFFYSMLVNTTTREHIEKLALYQSYRRIICEEDTHMLNIVESRSASYFHEWIEGKKRSYDFSLPKNMKKVVCNIYEDDLNIQIDTELAYLAFPMEYDNRCIGIIRVLLNSSLNTLSADPINYNEKVHGTELLNLLSLVGMMQGNRYQPFNYSFKAIPSNATAPKDNVQANDLNALLGICQSLAARINSKACILRFGESSEFLPYIKGWTNNIESYISEILFNDHFLSHYKELDEIFNSGHRENIDLIGIVFKVGDSIIEDMKYIYSYENDILNITDQASDINIDSSIVNAITTVFNHKVYKKLKQIDINHVLVIKVPHIPNGYISFANTQYRFFTKKDIDTVYVNISTLGSSLLKVLNLENEKKRYMLETHVEALKEIQHDINPLLGNISSYRQAILAEQKKILDALDPTLQVDKAIMTSVNSNNDYLEKIASTTNIIHKRLEDYDLIDIDEPISYHHQINLARFIKENISLRVAIKNYPIKFNLDEDIWVNYNAYFLGKILNNLTDNAIKYNFTFEQRMMFDPNFDSNNFYFIQINLFKRADSVLFEMINWGHEIPSQDKEKVFKLGHMCALDQNKLLNAIPNRNGKGLYYVRTYVTKLKGNIEAIPNGIETKMQIIWNQKQI